MDMLLVAGLWLGASAWDDVVVDLARRGHRGVPIPLPGQGADPRAATLDDQVAAVVDAVDRAEGPVVVVGHSAAATLAWLAADARPAKVAVVVLIGGWPSVDGEKYADFFEPVDGFMHFPGWAPFEGADSADLDERLRSRMDEQTVPVPEGVSRAVVTYGDPQRRDVPVVLVCPEFTPADIEDMLEAGDLPELESVKSLRLVDLDSGHWPMFSAPAALAGVLADVVESA